MLFNIAVSPVFDNAVSFAASLLRSLLVWLSQSPVTPWLLAPGLLICRELGLDPSGFGPYAMAGIFLFSWWAWVRSLRVLYCVTGKIFGFYDPKHYLFFTRLFLPWRTPYLGLMFLRRWLRQLGHSPANARWTGYLEAACRVFNAKKDCILVGTLEWHRIKLLMPVAIPGGERHVFICAGSGAGKTTQIMTNIGCLDPSAPAFIVDCDGAQVNALGAALEAAGHLVVKLDPDNIAKGFPRAGKWNPLDELTRADRRHGRAAVVSFAAILANALIVQDSQTQPVFADTARVFMKGLILYVWLFDETKNLLRLRALLTGGLPEKVTKPGEDPFERLIFEMTNIGLLEDDGCNGEICAAIAAAAGVMNMGRNEKGNNFKSTAIYQTAWLDDPAIRATMDGESDVCGEDLKLATNAPVVFMVGTLTDIQTRLSPWVRAFSTLVLYAFQRTAPEKKLKYPCLFILDEFPSLGRMEIVATAAPGFRKYGVRLITISQSLQRMQKTYPEEWRDFLGNAQACVWMGLDDPETLKFLSEQMLGQTMKKEKVDGWHWLPRLLISLKLPRARHQMTPRWLLDVQQCKSFLDPTAGRIIVTRFGRAPLRLFRLSYWRELPVWKYAAGPHGESVSRAFTRAIWTSYRAAHTWLTTYLERAWPVIKDDLADKHGKWGWPLSLGRQLGYGTIAFFFGSLAFEASALGWRLVFGIVAVIYSLLIIFPVLVNAGVSAAAMLTGAKPDHPYRAITITTLGIPALCICAGNVAGCQIHSESIDF